MLASRHLWKVQITIADIGDRTAGSYVGGGAQKASDALRARYGTQTRHRACIGCAGDHMDYDQTGNVHESCPRKPITIIKGYLKALESIEGNATVVQERLQGRGGQHVCYIAIAMVMVLTSSRRPAPQPRSRQCPRARWGRRHRRRARGARREQHVRCKHGAQWSYRSISIHNIFSIV